MFHGTLKLSTPTDREIVMTRVFDAPRALVWRAWTEPDLLQRWLGVHNGWSLAECEVDLRVGGRYRYLWKGPGGMAMGMGGVFKEIQAPFRLVATEKFDEAWYPGEALDILVLEERNGQTYMTQTVEYQSKEVWDAVLKTPMEQGLSAGYDALDGVLAGLPR